MVKATKASGKKKQVVIGELESKFSRSQLAVITEYRGLKVSEISDLRGQLRKAKAEFHVTKNTLTKIAAQKAGVADMGKLLEGPTAIAFCYDDLIPPTKLLAEYARTSKVFKIRGGIMDGKILSADDVKAVATLPPREVVLAQVVGMMNMPIVNLVTVLVGPIRNLANVLKARQEQLEKSAAA